MSNKICEIIQKNPALVSLKNEAILNLSPNIVEISTAIAEIAKCKSHLQINSKSIDDTNLVMDSIQYNAFDDLFNKATLLRGISKQPYVTGLRTHIGLKGDNIVLFFQPTCLIKSSNPAEPYRYYTFDGLYYYYDESREIFTPATTSELIAITNYQTTIKIKHYGSNAFEDFDPQKDTKSVIIPFQVIYSLIYDNDQNSDVFLFNTIVTAPNKINHTILMGSGTDQNGNKITTNSQLVGDFTGKYANRSHLCPPCDYVDTLSIINEGPTTCP